MAYLFLFLIVILSLTIYLKYSIDITYGKLLRENWWDIFMCGLRVCCLAMLFGCLSYLNIKLNPKKFEYEINYGQAYYINEAEGIENTSGYGTNFYVFNAFVEDDVSKWFSVGFDEIDLLRIDGVKPCFVPVESFSCINPPILCKWFFHKKPNIRNVNNFKGKLILDTTTSVKKYEIKREEIYE